MDNSKSIDEVFDAIGDYFDNELPGSKKSRQANNFMPTPEIKKERGRPRLQSTSTHIGAESNSSLHFSKPRSKLTSFHEERRNSQLLDPNNPVVNMELANTIR